MKTFIRVALVLAIVACFLIPVSASESDVIWAGDETESVDNVEPVQTTYADHLLLFLQEHGSKIGIVALLVFETAGAILTKVRTKSLKDKVDGVFNSQNGVVSVTNKMIDGYNALKAKYAASEASAEERDKIFAAVMLQNITILDILDTVFVNLKNLPQGTKDLVNVRYAKCLSLIDDNEKMADCVAYIRGLLTEAEVQSTEEPETEEDIDTEEVS